MWLNSTRPCTFLISKRMDTSIGFVEVLVERNVEGFPQLPTNQWDQVANIPETNILPKRCLASLTLLNQIQINQTSFKIVTSSYLNNWQPGDFLQISFLKTNFWKAPCSSTPHVHHAPNLCGVVETNWRTRCLDVAFSTSSPIWRAPELWRNRDDVFFWPNGFCVFLFLFCVAFLPSLRFLCFFFWLACGSAGLVLLAASLYSGLESEFGVSEMRSQRTSADWFWLSWLSDQDLIDCKNMHDSEGRCGDLMFYSVKERLRLDNCVQFGSKPCALFLWLLLWVESRTFLNALCPFDLGSLDKSKARKILYRYASHAYQPSTNPWAMATTAIHC